MAYGCQIWSDNGRQWVDVVQPSWVIDMCVGYSGNGSRAYSIDPRFHLRVAVLSHTRTYKRNDPPSFSISGGNISWHLPAACTFIVFMEQ